MIKPFGDESVYYIDVNYLNHSSIVYSCGIGHDFSFDLELTEYLGRPTYSFDPTPPSQNKYVILDNLNKPIFYNFGISNINGEEEFKVLLNTRGYMSTSNIMLDETTEFRTFPVRTIPSIMQELNHSHIDLLRMDIEGAEFKVLPTLFNLKIYPTQISLEFHDIDNDLNVDFGLKFLDNNGYTLIWNSDDYKEFTFIRSFLLKTT